MRNRIILLLIGFMCYAGMGNAQEDKTEKAVPAIVSDSVEVAAPDSTVQAVLMAADSVGVPEVKMKLAFKPNPTKAVLFALVPGLGQIYNRKYWKLPIVYGGLMGCMYAVTWNNKNYKDYSTAYKDIMYDAAKNLENPDAWSKSWQDLTSMAPEDAPEVQLALYEQILAQGLSVRNVEEMVRNIAEGIQPELPEKKKSDRKPILPEEFKLLKDHLSRYFNTKVQLTCNEKGKGKITIPFATEEELEQLIGLLDKLK